MNPLPPAEALSAAEGEESRIFLSPRPVRARMKVRVLTQRALRARFKILSLGSIRTSSTSDLLASRPGFKPRIQPRRRPISSSHTTPRKFKIEGSGQMLEALAQAIDLALRAARTTPDRTGAGSISRGPLTIEVEATNSEPDRLKYVIASIEDAVSTVTGWAETKRCIECEQPVALLFDDAYLETQNGEGVICCESYRRTEDS
jgi:hypothetical protein